MKKLRVMTIVGTRPEIIRLSEVIKACDKYLDLILVHTGQNWDYSLNQVFFDELGLRQPDHYLDAAGVDLGETIGNIISRSYKVMMKERPDAVLILGDTNSCLSAISAKRLKIPVFHMEAGNRCFDENVPEEINRRLIDHVSDVNMAYTEHSRRYLLNEGIAKDRVFVTGSPMREVISKNVEMIQASGVLGQLGIEENRYIVVSAHREENIDREDVFLSLMNAINSIADRYQMPVIYSTHPRSWKRLEERAFRFNPLVRQLRPFGFFDYCKLQTSSYCVLSDSGTLSEESAMLGFPGVLIRSSTERPEVLDKGSIVIGGTSEPGISEAIQMCRSIRDDQVDVAMPLDYLDENVSIKVVKLIQSYTRYVDMFVWRKQGIIG